MKSSHCAPLIMGSFILSALLAGSASAGQSLTSFGTSPASPATKRGEVEARSGTYAPTVPPAASVPGTLYVPPTAERQLNESDDQFIARQTVRQESLKREQAQLLQDHARAMRQLVQVSAGRPRTQADDAAAAAYRQFAEQAQRQATLAQSRAPGYRAQTSRPGTANRVTPAVPQRQR